MKTFKILIVTLLLVSVQNLLAQPYEHEPSRTNFDYIDMLNFSSEVRREIAFAVNKAIDNGKLKVYADKNLTKRLTPQEYYDRLITWGSQVIPNPDNPEDIYDLIDTVIFDEVFPTDFIFHNNKVVECINEHGARVFLRYKQVKKNLDSKQVGLIKFYKKNGLELISDKTLLPLCKKQVNKAGKELYSLGIEGKIKCYWNDSLRGIITVKEIKDRTSIRVNTQHQNPENPEDPYDLIDTVITQDFNPDSINTIRVYFEWENKGLESRLKIYSIAPLHRLFIGGEYLFLNPIFHVKADTYRNLTDKDDEQFWGHFYTFLLKNRASSGYFQYYTEDNLPNGN